MRILVPTLMLATSLAVATGAGVGVRAASSESTTPPIKDQARMPSDMRLVAGNDHSGTLVQLAQASRPHMPGPGRRPPDVDFNMQPLRGPMTPGVRPTGGPLPMAMHAPPGPLPPNRAACEEDINRSAAMAGYIKSKLQLQGSQKDAWRKIEEAAEPAVEKLRQTCALLPVGMSPPPSLPEAIDLAAKQFAIRAAFLQAISGPVHALYETLSSDQRAALSPPPPPGLL